MTKDEQNSIAASIDRNSKGDRRFAYTLLIVVAFVAGVVGYDMLKLVSSLSVNMQSMSSDMKIMSNEIVSISHNVKSMTSDIHSVSTTLEGMTQSIEHMNKNMGKMQEDITDMNKMNPLRKIF